MRRFEYDIRSFKHATPTELLSALNDLGSQGWELVTIGHNALDGVIYYFKREIQSDAPQYFGPG